MLAQQQAIGVVQGDVEGVAGGGGHAVGHAAVHTLLLVGAAGVVVHQGDHAGPELGGVYAGEDGDAHTLHDTGVQAQLVEGALDLEGTGLLDGDVGGAVLVDGADGALDGTADHGVFQHILVVGDLGLEGLLVIGGLGVVSLDGAQLQVQGGTLVFVLCLDLLVLFLFDLGIQILDLLLQVLDLGVQVGDLAGQLVHLQLLLVDGEAEGVGVVLEELLVDPDGVAHGHIELADPLFRVALDLHGIVTDDHTGELVGAGGGGGQHAGLLHIDLGLLAAAGQADQQGGTQGDDGFFHIHGEGPPS